MTTDKSYVRTRNLYSPLSKTSFKLSRSKLELFLECPRCFYVDRRLGVGRPPGFPFTLNAAVDALLKKEFDSHRKNKTAHPLMEEYGIDAVPFAHKDMDKWRENFVGVQYYYAPANFIITGAVDDIWQDRQGDLMVVDYKATSTEKEITLDEEYRQSYKRQMEIYQWLMRHIGHKVSNRGYFVYANGRKNREAFHGKLEFDIKVISYDGDDSWVDGVIVAAKICLDSDVVPKASEKCEYCAYREAANKVEEK